MSANSHVSRPAKPLLIPSKRKGIPIDAILSLIHIYDQLTSEIGEKFTAEQAQYAIDNIKGDYLEAALKSAKNYQETMKMCIRDSYYSISLKNSIY